MIPNILLYLKKWSRALRKLHPFPSSWKWSILPLYITVTFMKVLCLIHGVDVSATWESWQPFRIYSWLKPIGFPVPPLFICGAMEVSLVLAALSQTPSLLWCLNTGCLRKLWNWSSFLAHKTGIFKPHPRSRIPACVEETFPDFSIQWCPNACAYA